MWSLFDGVNSINATESRPDWSLVFPLLLAFSYPHIWEFPPERFVLLDGLNKFKTFPDKADTLLFKPSRNYSIHFFNGETQPLQTGCAKKFIKKNSDIKCLLLSVFYFLHCKQCLIVLVKNWYPITQSRIPQEVCTKTTKAQNELYDRYLYDSDKPYMILKHDCLFIFLKCALITRNPIFTRK